MLIVFTETDSIKKSVSFLNGDMQMGKVILDECDCSSGFAYMKETGEQ